MQNLNFVKGEVYIDRKNNAYTFIEKRGGVIIFEDLLMKRECRNGEGRYRWDNKDDDRDIIGELDDMKNEHDNEN